MADLTEGMDLREILKTLKAAADRKKYNKLLFFQPYDKQKEFFAGGVMHRERLLMAGNQVGKTEAGAYEAALHLTGEYPEWWKGRRWARPTLGWIAGETALLVRNIQQKKLCGEPGVVAEFGTGYIPLKSFIERPSLARGIADAYDTMQVKHKSGGTSIARFKSYEQGRAKFQAESVDWVWWDEEPDSDIYSEGMTRITATGGMEYMTFTPLKGMSSVVARYINEPSPDRMVTTMTIHDAKHIPEKERQKIIDGYPVHERQARAMGVPLFGDGLVFSTPEANLYCELAPGSIPTEWKKLWGIDFGIAHPFAAVLCAYDADADVFYVLHAIRMADARPLDHAAAMKPLAVNAPVAWPHDGTQRDKGSGDQLAGIYRAHDLLMHGNHATWPDGGNSFEAGILEMDERMKSERFKVNKHLVQWFDEYRQYHRKDGQVVKERDDLLSATRIAVMMKRIGKPVNLGGERIKRRRQIIADGLDFPLF